MKELLKDQKVIFHSHNAGNGQEEKYGKGLHIHKTMLGNNHAGVQIIIPIDSSNKIRWKGTSISRKEKMKLISEIKHVLKDPEKTIEFAKEMCISIKRYTNESQNIDENIEDGLSRIAKLLGFNSKIMDTIKTVVNVFKDDEENNTIEEKKSIYTAFIKDEGQTFYVTINQVKEAIEAGQVYEQCLNCKHFFDKKINKNSVSECCSVCVI